ncbi:ATP-dependent dethiobiotin synthetase BioD, partial [Comamonas thiooxydans]
MIGCFVTGTDTGVGKTLASCALLHALAGHHARVVGMKAVAAGAEPDGHGGWVNEDTVALRAASTLAVPAALDNPVLLPDPMSPHIAARRAGVEVRLAPILDAYRQLAAQADAVVVE